MEIKEIYLANEFKETNFQQNPYTETFKRQIKSHLPSAGIIKNSPYSPH